MKLLPYLNWRKRNLTPLCIDLFCGLGGWADKSRILLTDESGGKHCVKFPSGAKD